MSGGAAGGSRRGRAGGDGDGDEFAAAAAMDEELEALSPAAGGKSGGRGAGDVTATPEYARLALGFEERLVEMSQQLLDAEIENASLREALGAGGSDARVVAERLHASRQDKMAAIAKRDEALTALDRLKVDHDDVTTELSSLQANLRNRLVEARAAREKIAALEATVAMQQAQVRELAVRAGAPIPGGKGGYGGYGGYGGGGGGGGGDVPPALITHLRTRLAQLTADADEFAAVSNVAMSPAEVWAAMQAPGAAAAKTASLAASEAIPESPFLTTDGKLISYAVLTQRLHESTAQNARMRAALEQAAEHIRALHDRKGGDEDGDGDGESSVGRLRGQLARYKDLLVKARDALVAAKAARGAGDSAKTAAMTAELRARCLELQERCGLLHRDNDRLRGAVATAAEAMAVTSGKGRDSEGSLAARLRDAERRCAEMTLTLSERESVTAAGRRAGSASAGGAGGGSSGLGRSGAGDSGDSGPRLG